MVLPRPTELSGRGLRLLAQRLHGPSPTAIPVVSRWPVAAAAAAAVSRASRHAAAPQSRPFSSAAPRLKKRKIAAPSSGPARPRSASPPPSSRSTSSTTEPGPEDPLDLSSLVEAYEPTDAHFKSQLHSILNGGRFDPSSLGALPVPVKPEPGNDGHGGNDVHGDDAGAARVSIFPLRELAQVVPRSGRAISLLVNDRAYIKPIMSAVQSSPDFNQQPQRSPDNDLELLMRVELDRPEDLVRRVKETVQGWRGRIRHDRTRRDKQLKEWRKAGAVLPDIGRMAEREVQKLQDKKMKEIDAEEARALRQLARK